MSPYALQDLQKKVPGSFFFIRDGAIQLFPKFASANLIDETYTPELKKLNNDEI